MMAEWKFFIAASEFICLFPALLFVALHICKCSGLTLEFTGSVSDPVE